MDGALPGGRDVGRGTALAFGGSAPRRTRVGAAAVAPAGATCQRVPFALDAEDEAPCGKRVRVGRRGGLGGEGVPAPIRVGAGGRIVEGREARLGLKA